MSAFYSIATDGGPAHAAQELTRLALESGAAAMVLCTAANPNGPVPMPALFTDAAKTDQADPLAPIAMVNAGTKAAAVLGGQTGAGEHTTLLILKPCERRALVELAKLNQCSLEGSVVVSMDCLGRMERPTYLEALGGDASLTQRFLQDGSLREKINPTCGSCEAFTPEGADVALLLLGGADKQLVLAAQTDKGEEFLGKLGLPQAQEPGDRAAAVEKLRESRAQGREKLFATTKEQTGDMAGLQRFLSACITCHNCRVACPVCYCRECVFTSDVFRRDGLGYYRKTAKRGVLRLPTDTTMYHLTRMAHMAHACVGCGQCSSVCPSDIAVADLFRLTASAVQKLYDYAPGRSLDEPIPYMAFDQPVGEQGE